MFPPASPEPGADGPARGSTARGRACEEIAVQYLRLRHMAPLARNLRAAGGEVDLVARDGHALVFVEVRMRGVGAWSTAQASIDPRKRRRLRSCARALLRAHPEWRWSGRTVRFDVVALELGGDDLKLSHLRAVRLE
jgi:putative endonuclease